MKRLGVLLSVACVAVVGLGSIPGSADSGSINPEITVCVDWSTKELRYSKYWDKCPPRTTPLSLGLPGEPVSQNSLLGKSAYEVALANGFVGSESEWLTSLRGPAGPSGPSGPSVNGFQLESDPVLSILSSALDSAPDCEARWSRIIGLLAVNGNYNIEYDALGQALGNKQWALDLAEGCPYIYPQIFENPNIVSVSDVVAQTATPFDTSAAAAYKKTESWISQVQSFDVTFTLDSGWGICGASDPQYSALNMNHDSSWTQLSATTWRYNGSAPAYFSGQQILDSDATQFLDLSVFFCGPDAATPSGLGYKSFSFSSGAGPDGGDAIRFPLLWGQVKP